MNEWQPLVIALAIPIFGLITALATKDRDPARYRRLKHSSTALTTVPEGSQARQALDDLVVAQARLLKEREADRTLNKANLALAIILFLFFAGVLWPLLTWVFATWTTPWAWISIAVTVIVSLIGLLFVFFGFAQIYEPPGKRKDAASSEN